MLSIQEFADKLTAFPESEFSYDKVLAFLNGNPVDIKTLTPYLFFCREYYTRNLIRRTSLFELLAICWESGQKSPIHNHRDQNCWMAMPHGRLQIHNFRLIKKDPERKHCELQSSGQFLLSTDSPQGVDPEEPIHQVLNLSSFDSRAVSLHIYSRPYDSCEVYDLKGKCYEDVRLVNTSEYGVLKDSAMRVEKVSLP